MKNRVITPLTFQDELCEEIEKIASDMLLRQPGTDARVKLKAYAQNLPVPEVSVRQSEVLSDLPEMESEVSYPFPWVLVKLDTGSVLPSVGRQRCRVIIIVGVFNDDLNRSGHRECTIILERIMERFAKDPLLHHKFTAVQLDDEHMFSWALQDEDTHPYYYGSLEMMFEMNGFEREDRYGYA